MENSTNNKSQIIADCYIRCHEELVNFAASRLGNREEGEDLVQDAFVRMMSYEGVICEATVKSFAFTITSNIIKDELRRRIFRARMEDHVKYERSLLHSSADNLVVYHETRCRLVGSISALTPACAKIYRMSLLEDMAAGDIAMELSLSKRTVETQLTKARKQVRSYMLKEA